MSKWITTLLLTCFFVSLAAGQNLVRTFRDNSGRLVDEYTIPDVPVNQRISGPVATPTRNTVMIQNVPAFDWSYGCAATSAAMLAGYYDRLRFDNMYAGPTNSGVMPMDNSAWGAGNCPLSATKTGLDNLVTDGHVNRFYVQYQSSGNDPFGTGDPTSLYSSCTADYMGTNQDWWHNGDGSTTIFTYNTSGAALNDFIEPETQETRKRDLMHGLKLFFESRGYVVTSNYNRKINGYNGITDGFTFADYMASIDAGIPVFIHVVGHTMLGVGYDSATSTVYLHDTWDYSTHTMIWGGVYSGMQHWAVSVITLAPATISCNVASITQSLPINQTASQNLIISNPGTQTLNYTCSLPPSAETVLDETFTSTTIPTGWTQSYESGTTPWLFQRGGASGANPSTAYDGDYNAIISVADYSFPVTKLITPALDLTGVSLATLTFWHTQAKWDSDQDELRVYYKTSSGGSWVLLQTYTSNITTWTQETIALPNLSGTYYIGFSGSARYGYGVCLDKVVVTKGSARNSRITLNGASSYTGSISVGGVSNTIPVSFNSTGLSVGTYTSEITVTSNSAANPSFTIPVTFNVTAPVTITISNPTTGTIWNGGSSHTISWSYSGSGTSITCYYSFNNGTSWDLLSHLSTTSGSNSIQVTAPTLISNQSKIKLVDSVSPNYEAISNTFSNIYPAMILNKTSIAYGTVLVNTTSVNTFTISNTGTATLTGNITTPAGYSVALASKGNDKAYSQQVTNRSSSAANLRNTLAYSISAGSSKTYNVTFAPTAIQAYNGDITITRNTIGGNQTIALTGQGGKPVINSVQTTYSVSIASGTTQSQTLTISNSGNMPLNYGLTIAGSPSWVTVQGASTYSASIAAGGADHALTLAFSAADLLADTYTATINGTSNDPAMPTFTISLTLIVSNTMAFVEPAGGEVWLPRSIHTISATYTGTGSAVDAYYCTDGGISWTLIGQKSVNYSTIAFPWALPDVASTTCRIKLVDTVAPYSVAISNLFSIMPNLAGVARNPFPLNNNTAADVNGELRWSAPATGSVTGYKVYLGTDNPPTNLVNGTSQTLLTYTPSTLAYHTNYYWKIVPYNAAGDTPNCPVWQFTTVNTLTVTQEPVLTEDGFVVTSVTVPDVDGYVDLNVIVNRDPVVTGFSNLGLQFILDPVNITLPGRTITITHDLRFVPEQIAYRILPATTWKYLASTSPNVTAWNSTLVTFTLPDSKADGDVEILFPSGSDETLAIELSSFTAVADFNCTLVRLNWTTQSETNHLGYNVIRSETNRLANGIRVNSDVITDGEHLGTATSYSYSDAQICVNSTYYYWLQSVDLDGSNTMYGPISITLTEQTTPDVSTITSMGNAYPNPFRMGTSTTIEVNLKEAETGTLSIYNVQGQVVQTYHVKPGLTKLTWNAKGCASGIYFQQLSTPTTNLTKKLVIIK